MNRLVRLEIESLAIIERLELPLGAGLCAFTGETGAGKSIVVDALGLLLGGRGSSELIRSGAESLLVSAFWDDESVASRRITAQGRSTARLEGEVVSLRDLGAQVGERLTLHGQHSAVALLNTRTHREFLDSALAGKREEGKGKRKELKLERDAEAVSPSPHPPLSPSLLERYHSAYRQYTDAKDRLERLRLNERERARELDLLAYQHKEIFSVKPVVGEEEPLEVELERLSNLEEIAAQASSALELLSEGEMNALGLVQEAIKALSGAGKLDPNVAALRESLKEAALGLKSVVSELRGVSEDSAPDPEELERIGSRLSSLGKLKQKYGATLEEVLTYGRTLEARLEELRSDDADLSALERNLEQYRGAALEVGRELRAAREAAALEVSARLVEVVRRLGMPHARLEFALAPLPEPGPHGLESVEILFSANPGEALGSLSSVASGGELSRVMLALSTVLGSSTDTVIFDEVDAGIGGAAANAVGAQLAQLAGEHQVLVVTHLAQIAARADHHYLVEKRVNAQGRTESGVRLLTESERLEELARMLSGGLSKAALEHARELRAGSARADAPDSAPKADAPKTETRRPRAGSASA